MKIIKILFWALVTTLITPSLSAQMNNWITPSYQLDVTTIPINSTLIPGKSNPIPPAQVTLPYSVANGAYDENNNLLFYVEDDNVFDASGTLVGPLGEYNSASCSSDNYLLNTEIVIVPVIETCDEFYVIYGMDNPVGYSPLLYIKITAPIGASPTITYNGSVFRSCGGGAGFISQAFIVAGHGGSDNIGIAASTLINGSKRYLYTVGFTGVVKSEITSLGISSGIVIADPTILGMGITGADFFALEVELSWDRKYLAWTSANGPGSSANIFIIKLLSNGIYEPFTLQTFSVENPRGIEFDSEVGATAPNLFISTGSGLKVAIGGTSTINPIITAGYDLSNTYLELAKNGLIYGVSPSYSGGTFSTELVGIDPNTFTVSSTINFGADSRYMMTSSYPNGVFTLPDQIDGEDYNYFKGVQSVSLNTIEINSVLLSANCFSSLHEFCQDEPILFYSFYNGNGAVQQYKIEIEAVSEGACATLPLELDYNGTWQTGILANGSDLKQFTDQNGHHLGNSKGKFKIQYFIEDECGVVYTETRYFIVIEPLPVNTILEIYNKNNSQVYLSASTDINNPVLVGSSSIGYRINNSTGTMETLTIEVNEVDNMGNWVKDIYDETKTVSGVSSFTYEALNSYCVDQTVWPASPGFGSCTTPGAGSGYTGYFSYTNGQYSYLKYFEIIITLSNQCNSSQASSYVYVDSRNNLVRYDDGENSPAQHAKNSLFIGDVTLYPNPSKGNITLEMNLEEESSIEIILINVLGKKVKTLEAGKILPNGFYKQQFDISELPTGMYIYQIKSNNSVKSGMISVH